MSDKATRPGTATLSFAADDDAVYYLNINSSSSPANFDAASLLARELAMLSPAARSALGYGRQNWFTITAPSNAQLVEGQEDGITYQITRSGATDLAASVPYQLTNNALATDRSSGYSVNSGLVYFEPGQTSATLTVLAPEDNLVLTAAPPLSFLEFLPYGPGAWDPQSNAYGPSLIDGDWRFPIDVQDDDQVAVDLQIPYISEADENDPGIFVPVNDAFDEGNFVLANESVSFDEAVHEIAKRRATADNEPHLDRRDRRPYDDSRSIWASIDILQSPGVGYFSVPPTGMLTFTFPENVKLWMERLTPIANSLESRDLYIPVISGQPVPYASRVEYGYLITTRSLIIEGAAPAAGQIQVSFTPDEKYRTTGNFTSSDTVEIVGARLDLATDSNNDGTVDLALGGTDDTVEEQAPGRGLSLNHDDDDGDGIRDDLDPLIVGGDDDLMEVDLTLIAANGATTLMEALEGSLVWVALTGPNGESNPTGVKLWANRDKSIAIGNGTTESYLIDLEVIPDKIYVEATARGDWKLETWLESGVTGQILTQDTLRIGVHENLVALMDFNGGGTDDDPASRIRLTRSEWESIMASRDTLGDPVVPEYVPPIGMDPQLIPQAEYYFLVGKLGDALAETMLAKINLEGVIDEFLSRIDDPASTTADLVFWAKEVVQRYDLYIFNYRLTLKLLAEVPDGFDAQEQQQYNSLGIQFSGVPFGPTLHHKEGLRADYAALGQSLTDLDDGLSVLRGVTEGTVVIGGVAVVVMSLPASAAFALLSGVTMSYGAYQLGVRAEETDNIWAAFGQATSDTFGVTSLAITFSGKDPYNGRIVGPEEYGQHLVGGSAFLVGVTATVRAVVRMPNGTLKTIVKEFFLGDQKDWPKAGSQGTDVILPGNPANALLEATAEVAPDLRVKTQKVRLDEAGVEVLLEVVAPRPPKVAPYSELAGELQATGLQANHLNQNAAYRDVIPEADGLAIGMRGNAFTEPGTQHYRFHEVLEAFWNRFRPRGADFGRTPINSEYGQALQNALEGAGLASDDAAEIAGLARVQREAYGLKETDPVPRIPGRLNQTPP